MQTNQHKTFLLNFPGTHLVSKTIKKERKKSKQRRKQYRSIEAEKICKVIFFPLKRKDFTVPEDKEVVLEAY